MEDQNINLKVIPPKDYLPKVAVVAVAALVVFLVAMTVAGVFESINKAKEGRYIGQGAQYKNTISISGEGKIFAKPDIGQVNLSVISNAKTVAAAQKDNTEKMNKINQAMKDLGVAEEDLKTANYNIYPQYQYLSGRSIIIGYEVSQTLEVKIRKLDKVGEILAKAADSGANQIGSLSFTFDDPEKLKNEARQEAIENAKAKAKELAGSLNVSLGKVVSFAENSSGGIAPIYSYAKEAYGMGGGGSAPDIQTGQNEIQVTVTIAYEIY